MRRLHSTLLSACSQARLSQTAATTGVAIATHSLLSQTAVPTCSRLPSAWLLPPATWPAFHCLSTSTAAAAPATSASTVKVGEPHTVSDPSPQPSNFDASGYPDRRREDDDERYYGRREDHKQEERQQEQEQHPSHQLRSALLDAALRHVPTHGWSEAALLAAAQDLNVSPAAIGLLTRREGDLVHHFILRCNARLRDVLQEREADIRALPSKQARLAFALRTRLELNKEHINSWSQALAVAARPSEMQHSLHALACMVDDVWYALGDVSTNETWYLKRAAIGAVYTSAELFMVADYSPNFQETWSMLERRLGDVVALGDWLQLRPTQVAEEAAWDREAGQAGRGQREREYERGSERSTRREPREDAQWEFNRQESNRREEHHGRAGRQQRWREFDVDRAADDKQQQQQQHQPDVEFTDPQTGKVVKVEVRPAASAFR